jgi:hypothetical protein
MQSVNAFTRLLHYLRNRRNLRMVRFRSVHEELRGTNS